ncbi:ParB/RepB/Spo0J family partition protein [Curtobacterium sp. VKM Ac-1395]|uniref:ParB/RepB/Spo0J family partition protein n=1 Tax=Curtobacterium sp. VKM Ac-1395 TaxID=2783815 RepID=UPI00188A0E21|nr:ParB N-terminal domain-containing protein [Curtobacterium sp. VKM Ac-1395]MBF4592091.1 ParB N-terminal domain-containing protein [Curtobacterium sp. VKM Ac-1395]
MTTTTNTQPTTEDTFEMLDPNVVIVESNVRTEDKTYLTKEFVDSIRTEGVLTPVLCRRADDGTVYVRAGQRRTLAAREAGVLLPARIVTADENTADRIVQQIIENDQREALSNADRAAAWQQLSLDGMTPTKIAKRTGRKANEVKAGLQVVESAKAIETVTKHDVTLDQAAILIEFEDDDDAHSRLIQCAEDAPAQFAHEVQRVRDNRARAARAAAVREELAAAGWTILDRSYGWGEDGYNQMISIGGVVDADGQKVTPDAVSDVEGREAVVTAGYGGDPQVSYLIPKKVAKERKYRDQYAAATASGPMTDEQKAERRALIENRKQWVSAEAVRREWLAAFLSAKTLPKDAITFAAEGLTGNRYSIGSSMQKGNAIAADILGVEGVKRADYYAPNPFDGWAEKHPTKALHAVVAVVIGGYEEATNKDTWRNPDRSAAAYFARLAAWGYVLSEVEQIVLDAAAEKEAKRAQAKADAEANPVPADSEDGDDFDGGESDGADDYDDGTDDTDAA